MAKNKKIEVLGFKIAVKENDFVSLTDIAKSQSDKPPNVLIASWIQNHKTLKFLEAWEELHNPDFKHQDILMFRDYAMDVKNYITAKKYIEGTGAIGMTVKAGRYGGTFAHRDIATAFAYWLEPKFQVYMIKEFIRLKERDLVENTTDWALDKVNDLAQQIFILSKDVKGLREGKQEEE